MKGVDDVEGLRLAGQESVCPRLDGEREAVAAAAAPDGEDLHRRLRRPDLLDGLERGAPGDRVGHALGDDDVGRRPADLVAERRRDRRAQPRRPCRAGRRSRRGRPPRSAGNRRSRAARPRAGHCPARPQSRSLPARCLHRQTWAGASLWAAALLRAAAFWARRRSTTAHTTGVAARMTTLTTTPTVAAPSPSDEEQAVRRDEEDDELDPQRQRSERKPRGDERANASSGHAQERGADDEEPDEDCQQDLDLVHCRYLFSQPVAHARRCSSNLEAWSRKRNDTHGAAQGDGRPEHGPPSAEAEQSPSESGQRPWVRRRRSSAHRALGCPDEPHFERPDHQPTPGRPEPPGRARSRATPRPAP